MDVKQDAMSSSHFMVRCQSPSADRRCHNLQAALRARPRKAVDIKAPLKNDAKLVGIRAKLVDGELTITIPKQVGTQSCCPCLLPDAWPSSLVVQYPQKEAQNVQNRSAICGCRSDGYTLLLPCGAWTF